MRKSKSLFFVGALLAIATGNAVAVGAPATPIVFSVTDPAIVATALVTCDLSNTYVTHINYMNYTVTGGPIVAYPLEHKDPATPATDCNEVVHAFASIPTTVITVGAGQKAGFFMLTPLPVPVVPVVPVVPPV